MRNNSFRKISSIFATLAVLIATMPTFANTRLQDDLITIGKPGSSANKRIKLGSTQEIRANSSTNKLEFAHDGANFKPLGSGSGSGGTSSGINLITNESFEDPISSGWTNTGGTLTQETYLNGTDTDAKYLKFVATAAGQYFETSLLTVPSNFSGGCEADFKKINVSTSDLFKLEIIDSSSNVLSIGSIKKSSWAMFPTISSPCPEPGTQFKLRVTSLAAGTIEADHGYLGSNQNLISISQAKYYGTVEADTSCAWTTSSTSYTSYSPDSTCSYTVSGNVLAPSSNIPGFQIPAGAQPGVYLVIANYSGYHDVQSGTPRSYYQAFYDGTALGVEDMRLNQSTGADTANVGSLTSTVVLSSSLSSAKTFEIRGKTGSTSNSVINNDGTSKTRFDIFYYPSNAESALRSEQATWFIDANIGGSNAVISSTTSTYTEITSSSLDLVVNSSKGSANAQIPCSGTNPSSGLTCASGSESVGISFTPPKAGVYEACVSFSPTMDSTTATNSASSATFQLVETPNNSQTILQEGNERKEAYIYKQNLGSGGVTVSSGMTLCGRFNFNSTTQRTIRLMYESNSLSPNFIIYADRGANLGQRDINFTVKPWLTAENRPILTGDQVTTPGANNPEFFSFTYGTTNASTVCSVSPCSYLDQIGNAVLNVLRPATGDYTANFSKTFSNLKCTIFVNRPGLGPSTIGGSSSLSCSNCSSLSWFSLNGISGAADTVGNLLCHGVR